MKVNFVQAAIVEAVATATACVASKSAITATEGLMINCEGDRAVLISYDLEKGIRVEMDADIIEHGSCIINAQSFSSIIKLMPSGLITLEVGDSWRAKVYAGKSEFEINAMNPKEYPTLPDISNRKGFNIKQLDMRNMILQTLFAVAQNDSRPAFNGALFRIKGNRITTVGCDSFRLAIREKVCELENTYGSELDCQFIVPGRTLTEVVKLMSEPEKTVSISIARKQVIFRFEERDIVFFTRLIDAEYIDYERTIPKNSSITVDIDTASFEGALSRAAIVSDEAAGKHKSAARCRFGDNRLEITSVSASGKVRDEIATCHHGAEIEIGFNCRYLTEALKASQCDRLRLSLSSPYISMVMEPLEPDENDRFTFLVLPIRMQK